MGSPPAPRLCEVGLLASSSECQSVRPLGSVRTRCPPVPLWKRTAPMVARATRRADQSEGGTRPPQHLPTNLLSAAVSPGLQPFWNVLQLPYGDPVLSV